jgi:hypothetical protein
MVGRKKNEWKVERKEENTNGRKEKRMEDRKAGWRKQRIDGREKEGKTNER